MNLTQVTRARSLSALAMVAALAAAPLAASAAPGMQADGGPRFHQQGGHDSGRHGGDFARHDGDRGMRALDLSQDQKDQIFKIRHNQEQAFYDGKKAVRAARQSLSDIGRADSFDEAKARQAADALGQAQAQMALLRVQTQSQIRAVLTPEQRQKLADMRAPKKAEKPAKS